MAKCSGTRSKAVLFTHAVLYRLYSPIKSESRGSDAQLDTTAGDIRNSTERAFRENDVRDDPICQGRDRSRKRHLSKSSRQTHLHVLSIEPSARSIGSTDENRIKGSDSSKQRLGKVVLKNDDCVNDTLISITNKNNNENKSSDGVTANQIKPDVSELSTIAETQDTKNIIVEFNTDNYVERFYKNNLQRKKKPGSDNIRKFLAIKNILKCIEKREKSFSLTRRLSPLVEDKAQRDRLRKLINSSYIFPLLDFNMPETAEPNIEAATKVTNRAQEGVMEKNNIDSASDLELLQSQTVEEEIGTSFQNYKKKQFVRFSDQVKVAHCITNSHVIEEKEAEDIIDHWYYTSSDSETEDEYTDDDKDKDDADVDDKNYEYEDDFEEDVDDDYEIEDEQEKEENKEEEGEDDDDDHANNDDIKGTGEDTVGTEYYSNTKGQIEPGTACSCFQEKDKETYAENVIKSTGIAFGSFYEEDENEKARGYFQANALNKEDIVSESSFGCIDVKENKSRTKSLVKAAGILLGFIDEDDDQTSEMICRYIERKDKATYSVSLTEVAGISFGIFIEGDKDLVAKRLRLLETSGMTLWSCGNKQNKDNGKPLEEEMMYEVDDDDDLPNYEDLILSEEEYISEYESKSYTSIASEENDGDCCSPHDRNETQVNIIEKYDMLGNGNETVSERDADVEESKVVRKTLDANIISDTDEDRQQKEIQTEETKTTLSIPSLTAISNITFRQFKNRIEGNQVMEDTMQMENKDAEAAISQNPLSLIDDNGEVQEHEQQKSSPSQDLDGSVVPNKSEIFDITFGFFDEETPQGTSRESEQQKKPRKEDQKCNDDVPDTTSILNQAEISDIKFGFFHEELPERNPREDAQQDISRDDSEEKSAVPTEISRIMFGFFDKDPSKCSPTAGLKKEIKKDKPKCNVIVSDKEAISFGYFDNEPSKYSPVVGLKRESRTEDQERNADIPDKVEISDTSFEICDQETSECNPRVVSSVDKQPDTSRENSEDKTTILTLTGISEITCDSFDKRLLEWSPIDDELSKQPKGENREGSDVISYKAKISDIPIGFYDEEISKCSPKEDEKQEEVSRNGQEGSVSVPDTSIVEDAEDAFDYVNDDVHETSGNRFEADIIAEADGDVTIRKAVADGESTAFYRKESGIRNADANAAACMIFCTNADFTVRDSVIEKKMNYFASGEQLKTIRTYEKPISSFDSNDGEYVAEHCSTRAYNGVDLTDEDFTICTFKPTDITSSGFTDEAHQVTESKEAGYSMHKINASLTFESEEVVFSNKETDKSPCFAITDDVEQSTDLNRAPAKSTELLNEDSDIAVEDRKKEYDSCAKFEHYTKYSNDYESDSSTVCALASLTLCRYFQEKNRTIYIKSTLEATRITFRFFDGELERIYAKVIIEPTQFVSNFYDGMCQGSDERMSEGDLFSFNFLYSEEDKEFYVQRVLDAATCLFEFFGEEEEMEEYAKYITTEAAVAYAAFRTKILPGGEENQAAFCTKIAPGGNESQTTSECHDSEPAKSQTKSELRLGIECNHSKGTEDDHEEPIPEMVSEIQKNCSFEPGVPEGNEEHPSDAEKPVSGHTSKSQFISVSAEELSKHKPIKRSKLPVRVSNKITKEYKQHQQKQMHSYRKINSNTEFSFPGAASEQRSGKLSKIPLPVFWKRAVCQSRNRLPSEHRSAASVQIREKIEKDTDKTTAAKNAVTSTTKVHIDKQVKRTSSKILPVKSTTGVQSQLTPSTKVQSKKVQAKTVSSAKSHIERIRSAALKRKQAKSLYN